MNDLTLTDLFEKLGRTEQRNRDLQARLDAATEAARAAYDYAQRTQAFIASVPKSRRSESLLVVNHHAVEAANALRDAFPELVR